MLVNTYMADTSKKRVAIWKISTYALRSHDYVGKQSCDVVVYNVHKTSRTQDVTYTRRRSALCVCYIQPVYK